ncbi:MAG: hypothetical protein PHU43_11495, partial [Candidatus Bipolaricaulis sp.]|nr:hypothetical protein [Candidatus Bipolaricaulis sp.]
LCAAPGAQYTIAAPKEYKGSEGGFVFQYWDRYNKATGKWDKFSEDLAVTVTVTEQGQIHAVYVGGPTESPPSGTIGTFPGLVFTGLSVCLDVSAVVASTTATTVARVPTYTPISVSILVNDKEYKTTDFQVCGTSDTRYALVAPGETTVTGRGDLKLRYRFVGWQRYNTDTKAWEFAGSVEFVGAVSTGLSGTLGSGGKVRAVYQG